MPTKILIVDDEQNLLRLMGMALHLEGYQPLPATSGPEALKKIQTEKPDLVILDRMLPGMSGMEILSELRGNPDTATLPVIMLTALGTVDQKVEGLKAGADEYVTKPVEMKELVARVESLLERTLRLRRPEAGQDTVCLAFLGAKGGVGTTTVALNLAALLARQAYSVVIAEFGNRPGGLSAHLELEPEETLAPPPAATTEVVRRHLYKYAPGIRLLPAANEPQDGQEGRTPPPSALTGALDGTADYVLLDLPGGIRPVLDQADLIFLVLEREPVSLRAAQQQLAHLHRQGIGRHLIKVVLVNRTPRAASLSRQDVVNTLGCDVAAVVPNSADALLVAQEQGQPLLMLQPEHQVLPAFQALLAEVSGSG